MYWKIGVSGIKIVFTGEEGHTYSATLLPEVPFEQGENHMQTVDANN